jgi:hypothetical protein
MGNQTQQKSASDTAYQKKNSTGIPDTMKARFESVSGFSFDDVRVHYNSEKPAQLQALAYTQGNQVYIGPGQEKHLGHELGHVVQQKAGVVRPTGRIGNTAFNTDLMLEMEADAFSFATPIQAPVAGSPVVQQKQDFSYTYSYANVVQAKWKDAIWSFLKSSIFTLTAGATSLILLLTQASTGGVVVGLGIFLAILNFIPAVVTWIKSCIKCCGDESEDGPNCIDTGLGTVYGGVGASVGVTTALGQTTTSDWLGVATQLSALTVAIRSLYVEWENETAESKQKKRKYIADAVASTAGAIACLTIALEKTDIGLGFVIIELLIRLCRLIYSMLLTCCEFDAIDACLDGIDMSGIEIEFPVPMV